MSEWNEKFYRVPPELQGTTLKQDKAPITADCQQTADPKLIQLAEGAANRAKAAAQAATEAQKQLSSLISEEERLKADSTLQKARLELAKQSLAAAQATLALQEEARLSAAHTITDAEKELEAAQLSLNQAQEELEQIKSLRESSEKTAQISGDAAEEAKKLAEEAAQRATADIKAEAAAAIIYQDAAKQAELAESKLNEARQKALAIIDQLEQAQERASQTEQTLNNLQKEYGVFNPITSPEEILQEKSQQTQSHTVIGTIWGYTKVILLAVIIAFALRYFVFEVTLVSGLSMYPTLNDGDNLLTNKISYRVSDIERGDIVTVNAPDKEETYYIKRIIGLPGEKLTINNNKIYINDAQLNEPYLAENFIYTDFSTIIPDNCYFVMGDNRDESYDSRAVSIGSISRENIRGKAEIRIFPFDNFGSLY